MTEEHMDAWIHTVLWLRVLVLQGRNRGKYRFSSGVTEYGSMVAWIDLRTQDETTMYLGSSHQGSYIQWWWFFVFENTQIGGYNESVRDLKGIARCDPMACQR